MVIGKHMILKAYFIGFSAQTRQVFNKTTGQYNYQSCPIQYPYAFLNFVEVDDGVKDCYCCCQRVLEHTDTHYINQNDIDKYCVEASIPVAGLPKNNTEGVELLEAEDNHIDKSEFRIFYRKKLLLFS